MAIEKYNNANKEFELLYSSLDQQITIGNVRRLPETNENNILKGKYRAIIGDLLKRLMVGLQVNDKLTGLEIVDIVNYIVDYYKDMNLYDIRTAFELVVVQGFSECQDYNTYGRFGANYVCKMLNNYRVHKQRRKIDQPLIPNPNQKKLNISPEASIAVIKKIAEETYLDFVNTGKFHLLNIDSIFTEMTNAGLTHDFDRLQPMYVKRAEAQLNIKNKVETKIDSTERQGKPSLLSALIFGTGILTDVDNLILLILQTVVFCFACQASFQSSQRLLAISRISRFAHCACSKRPTLWLARIPELPKSCSRVLIFIHRR